MGGFLEHPVTALVISVLFGALAMTGRLSRTISVFLFVLAWGMGLYGTYEASSYALWVRILFVVLFTSLVTVLARWSLVEIARVQLSVVCDIVGLPMGYEGDLWVLDTIWFNGLWKSSAPKNGERLWPEDGAKGVGYRCTVKNYGTQVAFGVSLSLDVRVFNWVQTGPSSWGDGDQKKGQTATILIPRPLGPQGSDEFSFYICSYDPEGSLSVRVPSVAWIDSDNISKKREVEVRIASPVNPLSVTPKLKR